MKLIFIIDKDYEKLFVKEFYGNNKEKLELIDNEHSSCEKYIKDTLKLYQKSWDEIITSFSKYVEDATGYNWFYQKYECVVSVIFRGISNWGEAPKIIRH